MKYDMKTYIDYIIEQNKIKSIIVSIASADIL